MKKTIYILALLTVFTFLSCDGDSSGDVQFYTLKVQLNGNLKTIKKGKPLPSKLLNLLDYTKVEDESKPCFGKYYVPEISYYRTDLDEAVNEDFPIHEMVMNSRMLVTKEELESNYDVNMLKVPNIFTKETNQDVSIAPLNEENVFTLNIFSDKKENVVALKSKIDAALCDGASQITLIVDTKEQVETGVKKPTTGGDIPEGTDICGDFTLPSMTALRAELQKIIDTSRSLNERATIAEKTWNKYFDADAYVAKYITLDDKNPEVWNPGEGKSYFISRIALLKSIININIIRVEYSKENNRISGIKIVECHASEQMEALQLVQ